MELSVTKLKYIWFSSTNDRSDRWCHHMKFSGSIYSIFWLIWSGVDGHLSCMIGYCERVTKLFFQSLRDDWAQECYKEWPELPWISDRGPGAITKKKIHFPFDCKSVSYHLLFSGANNRSLPCRYQMPSQVGKTLLLKTSSLYLVSEGKRTIVRQR